MVTDDKLNQGNVEIILLLIIMLLAKGFESENQNSKGGKENQIYLLETKQRCLLAGFAKPVSCNEHKTSQKMRTQSKQ